MSIVSQEGAGLASIVSQEVAGLASIVSQEGAGLTSIVSQGGLHRKTEKIQNTCTATTRLVQRQLRTCYVTCIKIAEKAQNFETRL